MSISRSTSYWLLALVTAGGAAFAYDVPPSGLPPMSTARQQVLHDHAVQAFRAQRYAAAYGRFVRLADTGHAPSAQLALAMFQHGEELFGNAWTATPEQQRRWQQLAQQVPVGAHEPAGE
ncbi:hypothetical protein [Pseudorhodoferax sp.]|uniref:hypothetical protein n=1 Tax=Pseudorhodoferax sp. TaxID=1993553 RepID=UPI0039E48200